MQEQRVRRRLAAIMAAEVAGYGRLMEANEEATLRAVQQCRAAISDPAVARHEGRIFKGLSDGFLAEFPSAVEAVACARDAGVKVSVAGRRHSFQGWSLVDGYLAIGAAQAPAAVASCPTHG